MRERPGPTALLEHVLGVEGVVVGPVMRTQMTLAHIVHIAPEDKEASTMNKDDAMAAIKEKLDAVPLNELTPLMHDIERYYRERYEEERQKRLPSKRGEETAGAEQGAAMRASLATISGKFIDENDWWPDGHVAEATIEVYSADDNEFLGGAVTNQNGYYSVSGPFFGREVYLVATPPDNARCNRATSEQYLTINKRTTRGVDFKDECKF